MNSNTNSFVTFPIEGTQTVAAGTLRIDLISGKAILPDKTVIPLANRSTQIKPLQSIFFNIDNDINIEMSLHDEITYKGLIPAGHFTIKNVKYDLIIITTSTSTEIAITGSYKIDCIVTEIAPLTLNKTDGIEIIAHQAITHPNSVVGSAIDVLDKSAIAILLFHASVQATTNTNPGVFLIQISGSSSGNEDWVTIQEYTATISLADREVITAIEPIGETILVVSSISGFDDKDKLYIQDTGTLLDSEWALCQRIVSGPPNSINLVDGLTNAKDASDVIWNDADTWIYQVDLTTITRIRVLFIHEGFAGADCHIKVMGITEE